MDDLLGQGLRDYYDRKRPPPLLVRDEDGSADEMLPEVYFRSFTRMPALEKTAVLACRGRVLEIGAGAGSHALLLQEQGLDVTALDISAGAVEVMRARGVRQAVCADIF